MQLSREATEANVIVAWERGRLKIGKSWLYGHVIVMPDLIVDDWAVSRPDALTLDDLAPAIDRDPEIILLGTGAGTLLPDTRLIAALAERRIGLEIMSTPAACRTYNVLVHEQRHVIAALFNFGPVDFHPDKASD